ncbi:MAG: LysR family transcriptional regulator [Paracoccaceae bacterium]
MARVDWDDLRFFHAVARTGSLSGAARELGVSQPTVGRKIRDLETALQAKLFDRLACGYSLTEAGWRIFDKATEMADAARCIADRVSGETNAAAGAVRLTCPEGLGAAWLTPHLRALRQRHPHLAVQVSLCSTTLDLANGEADVALRMGEPQDTTLVGRRIGEIAFHLYASRDYLAERGVPSSLEDLAAHRVIESGGKLAGVPQALLLRDRAHGASVSLSLDSLLAQAAAARAGFGVAALPTYLVAEAGDLVRVLDERFRVVMPLWLLTREDLRGVTRVRALQDFVIATARRCPPCGERAPLAARDEGAPDPTPRAGTPRAVLAAV